MGEALTTCLICCESKESFGNGRTSEAHSHERHCYSMGQGCSASSSNSALPDITFRSGDKQMPANLFTTVPVATPVIWSMSTASLMPLVYLTQTRRGIRSDVKVLAEGSAVLRGRLH